MAFDPASAFELLRQSYGSGLLDKLVAVAGQALDGLMEDTGLSMGDLLALLDDVPRETVLRVEEMAASSDPEGVVAKLAASLDEPGVAAAKLQGYLEQAVAKARVDTSADGGCRR
jgi:hypothetical protein